MVFERALLAEKLLCLSARRKARDLYDIWAVLLRKQEQIDVGKIIVAASAKFASIKKELPASNNLFSSALFNAYLQRWSGELADTVTTVCPALQVVWDEVLKWYANAVKQ